MSPFKPAGASVQSTTRSRGVRISGSNAGYTMFWGSVQDYWLYWLPTPFASFPFTSPPVRHRVPSHFNWNLPPCILYFASSTAHFSIYVLVFCAWWPLNATTETLFSKVNKWKDRMVFKRCAGVDLKLLVTFIRGLMIANWRQTCSVMERKRDLTINCSCLWWCS